ncbi:MAG: ATP-grasp fold domain-containing protein [bacterium]|nr:MAG: ATP-grasp fold domain-containing protein [bacterium]
MSIDTKTLDNNDRDNILFQKTQNQFLEQYERIFPDPLAPKTVVIVPSLTMDQEILAKIKGISYYEERLLCLLMLLRMPRTKIIYVTSLPIDPIIIDYYLHLNPRTP